MESCGAVDPKWNIVHKYIFFEIDKGQCFSIKILWSHFINKYCAFSINTLSKWLKIIWCYCSLVAFFLFYFIFVLFWLTMVIFRKPEITRKSDLFFEHSTDFDFRLLVFFVQIWSSINLFKRFCYAYKWKIIHFYKLCFFVVKKFVWLLLQSISAGTVKKIEY